MAASTARTYLDQPADERFESRIPGVLKRHAQTVARASHRQSGNPAEARSLSFGQWRQRQQN